MKIKKPLLALSSLFLLASCNIVQPGKLDDIAGTYQLIRYDFTAHYEGPDMKEIEDPVTHDLLKELGIKSYLVITDDNNDLGYYSYKDNNTEAYCDEMLQGYTFDYDEPELIEKITFANLEKSMDFYVQSKRRTLTDNTISWKGNIHIKDKDIPIGQNDTIHIKYKKVSSKTDLSYLYKKMKINSYNSFVRPEI